MTDTSAGRFPPPQQQIQGFPQQGNVFPNPFAAYHNGFNGLPFRFPATQYQSFSTGKDGPPQPNLFNVGSVSKDSVPVSTQRDMSTPARAPAPAATASAAVKAKTARNSESSASTPMQQITIENACLAYIRSELLRVDQHSVITNVGKNFGMDEIKAARESLFRNTGTSKYSYKGLCDPSPDGDRIHHCVSGIIGKMQELGNRVSKVHVKYVCSAEDLFRLFKFVNNKPVQSDIEERVAKLEREIKSSQNVPKSVWSSAGGSVPPNRANLHRVMRQSQETAQTPNKKRRFEESSSIPGGEPWNTVIHKKNGQRPAKSSGLGQLGKPSSNSNKDDVPEVFLFNFNESATPELVKEHFKGRGLNALNVRYRCHPESEIKRFVMKIRSADEFDLVVESLPDFTGCRWYNPMLRPDPSDRPKGYFNNGKYIVGPNCRIPVLPHVSLGDLMPPSTPKSGPKVSPMDIPRDQDSPVPTAEGVSAPAPSTPATTSAPAPTALATTSAPAATAPATTVVTSAMSGEVTTVPASGNHMVTNLLNCKPLNVQYSEVVHNTP